MPSHSSFDVLSKEGIEDFGGGFAYILCVCGGGGSCLPQFAVGLGVWKGTLTGDTEGPLWATRGFCVAEPLYI